MKQGHVFKAKCVRRILVKICQSLRAIQGREGQHSYLESTQENLHCLCILISIYCIFSLSCLVCGFLSQDTQDEDSAVHGSIRREFCKQIENKRRLVIRFKSSTNYRCA